MGAETETRGQLGSLLAKTNLLERSIAGSGGTQPRRERGVPLGSAASRFPRTPHPRIPEVSEKPQRDVQVLGLDPGEPGHEPHEITLDFAQIFFPFVRDHERDEGSDHATPAPRLRRTRSSAKKVARAMMSPREPPKRKRSAASPSPAEENPRKQRPTGFSGVPPSGPAIPVVETEQEAPRRSRAPRAISFATSALTAPWRRKVSFETPRRVSFDSFE